MTCWLIANIHHLYTRNLCGYWTVRHEKLFAIVRHHIAILNRVNCKWKLKEVTTKGTTVNIINFAVFCAFYQIVLLWSNLTEFDQIWKFTFLEVSFVRFKEMLRIDLSSGNGLTAFTKLGFDLLSYGVEPLNHGSIRFIWVSISVSKACDNKLLNTIPSLKGPLSELKALLAKPWHPPKNPKQKRTQNTDLIISVY